jgi:hypothetical protein
LSGSLQSSQQYPHIKNWNCVDKSCCVPNLTAYVGRLFEVTYLSTLHLIDVLENTKAMITILYSIANFISREELGRGISPIGERIL